ncbi:MAG: sulfocyanin-like copper-binding protein [Thermoplasmata archaeon]|nr:sulfocyanin-like copper-binding protein [Thermoplasmata archaeon]
MRLRGHRGRLFAIVLAVALTVAVFAGMGGVRPVNAQPVDEAGATTVDVTATTTFSFTPNTVEQVATGTNVTVSLTDAGSISHSFTIIGREGWVIPSTITEANFEQLVYGNAPAVLFNLNISSVGTDSATFTAPGPGWYEFVCTEPGHFAEGMYGFIAFGMNLPSNLTVSSGLPGPGAALFIIIGTIVSLVVIALVLGFVVGRRKGAMHEMPPERLGYAEPTSPSAPLPPSSDDHRGS